MSSLGYRKKACSRGHIDPLRNKGGACVLCQKEQHKLRYLKNREENIRRATERQKQNPDARRDYGRAQRLKVPVWAVRAAIIKCNGKCECCGKELTHKEMCLDHSHTTGLIRGVLCIFCNALDGMLNKQPDRTLLLLDYLEKHSPSAQENEIIEKLRVYIQNIVFPIEEKKTKGYYKTSEQIPELTQ